MLPMEKIKWEYEECSELLALFTSIRKGTKPRPRPDLKLCVYNKH